jgi:RNA polymerase sigma-70 factor, ECF subfamily
MSDRIIIQQVLGGDVEAFSRLVDRHYARCARIAVRILGNREDAEEAIQDAFLRAFKALGDYEDRERFSAWLTRILVNQCRTVLARTTGSRTSATLPPGYSLGLVTTTSVPSSIVTS